MRIFLTTILVFVMACGTDGKDGSNGSDSIDGIDGNNGASGADGSNGNDGSNGADGASGVDGNNGADGASGVDGASGTSGIDGTNGTDGTSGIDGSNGTDVVVKAYVDIELNDCFTEINQILDANEYVQTATPGFSLDAFDFGAWLLCIDEGEGTTNIRTQCTLMANFTTTVTPNHVVSLTVNPDDGSTFEPGVRCHFNYNGTSHTWNPYD